MAACSCGRTVALPVDRRRVRCPGCGLVHDEHTSHFGPKPVATAEAWKHEPADGPFDAYPVRWDYAPEDLERIRWGLVPRTMEEKWFVHAEGADLRFYRSWTGLFCYAARLTPRGIDEVRIARHLGDHPGNLALVRWIVEAHLIGHDWPFPRPPQ